MQDEIELVVDRVSEKWAEEFEYVGGIKGLCFEEEIIHLQHHLRNDKRLLPVALKNPHAMNQAFIECAASGISFNPILAQTYLIADPVNDKISFSLSYLGMIKALTAKGIVLYVYAEIICKDELFQLTGPEYPPPMARDSAHVTGAYMVAKTIRGEFLTHVITRDQILRARGSSRSVIANEKAAAQKRQTYPTPWETDTVAMIKKTVVKSGLGWLHTMCAATTTTPTTAKKSPNSTPTSAPDIPPPAPHPIVRLISAENYQALLSTLEKACISHRALLDKLKERTGIEIDALGEIPAEMVNDALKCMTEIKDKSSPSFNLESSQEPPLAGAEED